MWRPAVSWAVPASRPAVQRRRCRLLRGRRFGCGGFRRRRDGLGLRQRLFDRRRRGLGLRGRRLLLRGRQFGLQVGKFGIAQLEQALGFGELAFELAHAALQGIDFGGVAGRSSGTSGRITRRHQAQAAGTGLAARGGPATGETAHFATRFRGRDRGDFFAARNTEHGTRAQAIHVAFEGAGVAAVDRHHELIGARTGARGQAARDRRQAVATLHFVTVAATSGDGRGALGLGLRGTGNLARGCRTTRRGHGGLRRHRAVRREHRRIEQNGVFTHQTAAGPGGLDEQRQERLGDGFGGADAQNLRRRSPSDRA